MCKVCCRVAVVHATKRIFCERTPKSLVAHKRTDYFTYCSSALCDNGTGKLPCTAFVTGVLSDE